ncbi:MAG: GNAT family N-acetyltransferase, partial [Bacteroidota bacterium]
FFTAALIKDDMFASAETSRRIEKMRAQDPFHLTSRAVILGSLITKGDHLFLDRAHPAWKEALRLLISRMQDVVQEQQASQLMLREFIGDPDEELQALLLELGLTSHQLPNVSMIKEMSWKDHSEYLMQLSGRYRYDIRREILRHEDKFKLVAGGQMNAAELKECYDLYSAVHERAFELNVFLLPYRFFEAMNAHPEFDILRLFLNGETSPAAVMFSFTTGPLYLAMIVGLDYDKLKANETYKQILYRTVWRAWEQGCKTLDLAFTADTVKKKVGARPYQARAYVQLMDHYNHAVIAAMSSVS